MARANSLLGLYFHDKHCVPHEIFFEELELIEEEQRVMAGGLRP